MAFNFDLLKYVATDPTTAAFAGATSLLDYYGQKDAYEKNKEYLKYQQSVLEQNRVAKENGLQVSNFMANQVIAQQTESALARQNELSAQSIAEGARMGQAGSAAALVARDAQFQAARVQGQGKLAKEQQIAKSQLQLDNITLNYNIQSVDLDYRISNLDSPSILSSIVDVADTVYADFKTYERSRALEEKIINASLGTIGK